MNDDDRDAEPVSTSVSPEALEQYRRQAFDRLVDAGLLTEQQAAAYIYREIERHSRQAVADQMGVAVSTVDSHAAAARKKVEAARDTVDVVDALDVYRPSEPADVLAAHQGTADDVEPLRTDE